MTERCFKIENQAEIGTTLTDISLNVVFVHLDIYFSLKKNYSQVLLSYYCRKLFYSLDFLKIKSVSVTDTGRVGAEFSLC